MMVLIILKYQKFKIKTINLAYGHSRICKHF